MSDEPPESEAEQPAFIVTYDCGNCGAEFTRQYPAGKLVTMTLATHYRSPLVKDRRSQAGGERVDCEVCEHRCKLSIADREPIGEDIKGDGQ